MSEFPQFQVAPPELTVPAKRDERLAAFSEAKQH
jgi:hypothetical protein